MGTFIFVTVSKYQDDQKVLEQYKQGIADELSNCLKVGDDGELDSIIVGQIKSKKINDKQLVIDITPQGMSIEVKPAPLNIPSLISVKSGGNTIEVRFSQYEKA